MQKLILNLLLFFSFITIVNAQAPNGFYVGVQCDIKEANVKYYGVPLKIEVKQPLDFIDGNMHSLNNSNDLHQMSMVIEKVPENTWVVLKIGKSYFASCLRSKKQPKQRHQTSTDEIVDTTYSYGGFVVERNTDVQRIANFLKIKVIDRKHFGHQLEGKLVADQRIYSRRDSVILKCEINNTGSVPLQINKGGKWRGHRASGHFFFKVYLKGQPLEEKRAKLNTENEDEELILKKGDQTILPVNLSSWFDFDQPGTYQINWEYRLNLKDVRRPFDKKVSPQFFWDDKVNGTVTILVR